MLHYFFAFTILVHGLLHLMGFAHELHSVHKEKITAHHIFLFRGMAKWVDGMRLFTYASFIAAGILFMIYLPWWRIPAISGVLISQVLIIIDWQESKLGTLVNIVIMLGVISSYAN